MPVSQTINSLLLHERLPERFRATIERVYRPLVGKIMREALALERCLVVGLCGAQGSGKSTAALVLKMLLQSNQIRAAVLSIDDFYLTKEQRQALSMQVHPLLATRGVPGTHDVALASQVLAALQRPVLTAVPMFDKSRDDRQPMQEWPKIQGPMQVVILEGWCVGAVPQSEEALLAPINALEREFDAAMIWRRHVNAALAGDYRGLFARLDRLVLLQAPGFDVVHDWRLEQEHKLRSRLIEHNEDASTVMNDAAVGRFVAHYQRLTQHILAEMPARADMVLRLDSARVPIEVVDRWH